MLSLNCNGLKSSNTQAEFFALPDLRYESKIDPTMPSGFIFRDRFEVFRKDRAATGGVFIAIRRDLNQSINQSINQSTLLFIHGVLTVIKLIYIEAVW